MLWCFAEALFAQSMCARSLDLCKHGRALHGPPACMNAILHVRSRTKQTDAVPLAWDPPAQVANLSRQLLGRPAVNASESNCAHFLDARLELLWAEDWSALSAMVRAECDVAPV